MHTSIAVTYAHTFYIYLSIALTHADTFYMHASIIMAHEYKLINTYALTYGALGYFKKIIILVNTLNM